MIHLIKNIWMALAVTCFWGISVAACSDSQESLTPVCSFVDPSDGGTVETITLTCAGGDRMVQLVSNVDWSVNTNSDWCSLSNHSGVATDTKNTTMYLKISVAANAATEQRTAEIILQAGGKTTRLNIIQQGTSAQDASGWELAATAVQRMKAGLNIGNTLDTYGTWIGGDEPSAFETAWGNPVITPELIKAIKAGGFNAVRLPVTWWQHLDGAGNVKESWMDRVEEVVNYILDEDMYCILNVHHDTGGSETCWLRADLANYEDVSTRFASLWTQIASRFISYDAKLVFEGYNEMLDANFTWTQTDANGYEAHNRLAQLFVNTVRATGGNNAKRNLLVNTYSSDAGEKSVTNFQIPTDQTEHHLIVGVHIYTPGSFTSPAEDAEAPVWTVAHEAELTPVFERLNISFVGLGVPVIVGEFGAQEKAVEAERAKYTEYFVGAAKRYGITCFHWFDLINRSTYQWTSESVKNAILNAAQ